MNMGYFSNLALDSENNYGSSGYPSPKRQLIWRLEDLQNRHLELEESGAPYRNETENLHLNENDIRYAIPESFEYIVDIERAIDLAISDLYTKYDIDITEETFDDEQTTNSTSIIKFPKTPYAFIA